MVSTVFFYDRLDFRSTSLPLFSPISISRPCVELPYIEPKGRPSLIVAASHMASPRWHGDQSVMRPLSHGGFPCET